MRRTWIIIGVCMLLFTTFQIISAYAKYVANATATTSEQAGARVVKVTPETISNGRFI